jgi:hypothetical protein
VEPIQSGCSKSEKLREGTDIDNERNYMKEKETSEDFIKKFDHFRRTTPGGSVVIHTGLEWNFIELKEEFVLALKNDLRKKIMMAHAGIDELSPTDRFAIMMLEDAY